MGNSRRNGVDSHTPQVASGMSRLTAGCAAYLLSLVALRRVKQVVEEERDGGSGSRPNGRAGSPRDVGRNLQQEDGLRWDMRC